jgi:hypothetical protein
MDRLRLERQRDLKLHHALFTGGLLESTDDTSKALDLSFRAMVRDSIPAIALFGTAVGNQMIPSCLKVDHGLPICSELAHLVGSGQFYVDRCDPRLNCTARTFTDIDFATRRDDLRADREEYEQAMQMKIEYEYLVPGAALMHGFTLVHASPLERSCLGRAIELWREQPFIGGKSSSGNGRISLEYDPLPDSSEYLQYLRDSRSRVIEALSALADRLGEKL